VSDRLAAAIGYVDRGWRVLPLHGIANGRCTCSRANCRHPGKHPRTEHGTKDASGDQATLEAWWRQWPETNIGIATGAVSGLDVIDIDPRHRGDKTLAELVGQHGPLPVTLTVLTGGGGKHFYFVHVPGIKTTAGKLGPGIDVRGTDGSIVAPPSLHVSGQRYAWDVDHHPDAIAPAALPAWLVDLLVPPKRNGDTPRTDPAEWAALFADGADDGSRNVTATRLVGYLLNRRIDPVVALEIMRLWAARCRPPLEDDELCCIIASICRREEEKRKKDNFRV
jgi:hypothetical protein